MTDEALVKQVLQGSVRAFEELINRYRDKIANFIYRSINDRQEAEEVAQDVFVHAYFKLSTYDESKAKFVTWLYRIAYNLSINYIKSKKASILRKTKGIEVAEEMIEEIDFESEMNEADEIDRVKKVLDILPVKYKVALSLFYSDELNYHEISKVMKVPINTVRTLLRRGRLLLKKQLNHYEKK